MSTEKEIELYDKYLAAFAEHAKASNELNAAILRHTQGGYDPYSAESERINLSQAKRDAGQQCMDAHKAYADYRRTRVG